MIEAFAVSSRSQPTSILLELRGELDSQALNPLLGAYAKAAAAAPEAELTLDFSRVGYINSSGIAAIVSLLGRARSDQRHVVALGLSEHYRQIFEITRLSDFIEIRESPGDAQASPTPPPS